VENVGKLKKLSDAVSIFHPSYLPLFLVL